MAAEHAHQGPRRPQRSEDAGPHLASPKPGEHPYRSFYGMRIASEAAPTPTKPEKKAEPEPAE